nr:hypothetical protein GCM10020092_041220 [Actinoplanes digitatis]
MTSTTDRPAIRTTREPSWWDRQGDLIMRRPFNEWTFTHMNWLMPTERVARSGPHRPLPLSPDPLDLTYRFADADHTLTDLHRRTFTTAFVVLHHGEIVHETYPGAFAGPRTRMQLFSISKSVTSMLVGIALADGAIGSVKDRVTDYRPDFLGTAYDETTLAELLDMTSGVGEPELWDVPDSGIKRFEQAVMGGGDVAGLIRSAPRTAAPGEHFNYSTFDAQILGWVLEAATGTTLAEYAAKRLWRFIGADRDAYYWLTRARPRTALGAQLAQRHPARRRPPRPAHGERRRRRRHPDRAPRMGTPQPRQRPAPARRRVARPERLPALRLLQPVVDPGRQRLPGLHRPGRARPVPLRRPERRHRDRQVQRLAHPGRRAPRPGDHHRPAAHRRSFRLTCFFHSIS